MVKGEKLVQFRTSREILKEIDLFAKKDKRSRTNLINLILEDFIRRNKNE